MTPTSFIGRVIAATDCPVSDAAYLAKLIHADYHQTAISQLAMGETIDAVAEGPLAMNFRSAWWSLRCVVKEWFAK
jgi:hypothetical protein